MLINWALLGPISSIGTESQKMPISISSYWYLLMSLLNSIHTVRNETVKVI